MLGLLAFGQSEKSGDLPELYSSYDDIKQQFKYVSLVITVRNSSCEKVMFSQAFVKNSVHGRCLPKGILGYTPPFADTLLWPDTPS